jgi:PleD family two-component response regulator
VPVPQKDTFKSIVHDVIKQERQETGFEEKVDNTEAEESIVEKEVILVVEDNADARRYIRGALDEHYTVKEAVDGKDGIDKAKILVPDLIVSDVMMPCIDGYELCKTIKSNVATSHIPIILLTAKASEKSVLEGYDTGADDYITKPFSAKILLSRIRNLIQ